MPKQIISTENAPAAIGAYSQGVVVSGSRTLFVSGQIPFDPKTMEMVGKGDVRAQAEQVMKNLGGVLEAAGMGFGDVARATIFLADMGDFAAVNEVYATRFEAEPPARAAVAVKELPKGVDVEISCIAVAD